ncbi:Z1 domain protein [Corynebacterium urogenitale]|uniref:Z1 domain protein n=1 Tax=Corynebacterium urogenitale TaxID=2487892 RepID=A0A5J6Z3H6_9CORY|nr:Z1 domain-containing protein [Corynebacterium urogenitale]QFQ01534.1 Z1 domain protein [Corynebacterium urogenitale]
MNIPGYEEYSAEEMEDWIAEARDSLRGSMHTNKATLDQAFEILSKTRAWRRDRPILEEAKRRIWKTISELRTPTDIVTIAKDSAAWNAWYEGPDPKNDVFWPPVFNGIKSKLGASTASSIDNSSSKVVAEAGYPSAPSLRTRGLVVGYVQSGKTTNFMSVIAKAADEGYRLIVVLSGMLNNLRKQTQDRLYEDLMSKTETHWTMLTTSKQDFDQTINAALLAKRDTRMIAVVKKNSRRLNKLNDWLDGASQHLGSETFPILVIDDEADQASINVMSSLKQKNEISAINAQIRTLLKRQRTSYIGYTATPFANILIDPNERDDLYPKDFIMMLPRPKGYFGAEEIFGREPLLNESIEDADSKIIDAVNFVPEEDEAIVRPPSREIENWEPEMVSSLREAIQWFVLATAARWCRGQADKHSSMLIHTSPRTYAHERLADVVEPEIALMRRRVQEHDFLSELEQMWDREMSKNPQFEHEDFDALKPHIADVLSSTKLIVDNGLSDKRLDYERETQTVIAIGGNTLARGLTLEGLCCSYFVRISRTYDTLMQMGRWFGFRNGYEDLVRIWMPELLYNWYKDLATVEADLRREIGRLEYEGLDPISFKVKIRTHEALQVTSSAKMRKTQAANMSFANQRIQTILFEEKNRDFLRHNFDAVKDFLKSIQRPGKQIRRRNGSFIIEDVPTEAILKLMDDYRFAAATENQATRWELLSKYIQKESALQSLRGWNVSVFGQSKTIGSQVDLGLPRPVNTIRRTKISSSQLGLANINTLVGPTDRINDLDIDDEQRSQIHKQLKDCEHKYSPDSILISAHERFAGRGIGHLGIYVIDAKSAPDVETPLELAKNPSRVRRALNAEEHVVGLGFFMPASETDAGVEYISGVDSKTLTEQEKQEVEAVANELFEEIEDSNEDL